MRESAVLLYTPYSRILTLTRQGIHRNRRISFLPHPLDPVGPGGVRRTERVHPLLFLTLQRHLLFGPLFKRGKGDFQ